MQTAAGRRTLWRVLRAARTGEPGFVPRDPHATAYVCGQQSIGGWLLEEIWRADPAAYAQLRLEAEADERARLHKQEEEHDADE